VQYELTEEQKMLKAAVRKLAEEQIAPGAHERDEKEEFSWEMVRLLRDGGYLGIDFPAEYGGGDAGMLAETIVVEELSRVDASVGLLVADQALGALPIMLAGNKEVKDRFLPKLSTGEHLAAFALTETSGGSDVADFSCRAEKGKDGYIINGNKIFVTNGGVAEVVTVYVVTDPEKGAYKGSSVLAVTKEMAGLSVGKHEVKIGIRSSNTVELVFEDCHVPVGNLVGEEGRGFAISMKTLDFARPVIAAQALGIAQGALDYCVGYAKERIVFGVPIIQHEGIGFKLADMCILTEAARQLLYKTCSILQECPKDMTRLSPEQIRYSSMCKTFASDVAMKVTVEAVQVVGGFGYCRDYPLEQRMRDAKITQIYEGTNEIQRLVISRNL
jgi:alkylation response protein AidB-like acyl-CoA dehydrogenase